MGNPEKLRDWLSRLLETRIRVTDHLAYVFDYGNRGDLLRDLRRMEKNGKLPENVGIERENDHYCVVKKIEPTNKFPDW